MVVGFTTTYAMSAYNHWCCGFESLSGWGVQHYVIKFVSDELQVILLCTLHTTGATSGAGTAYTSIIPEFTAGF
jgi:serine protease inhibitor ecotin